MCLSGLTSNQFDDLLSPKETFYGLREITLLFRRIAHFVTHCEWVDDTVLVKKFNAYVIEGGEIDLKVQHVFKQLIARSHKTEETSNILDTLRKELKVYSFVNSRFSQEMWSIARDKCLFDNDALEKNLGQLSEEQAKEFRKLFEDCKADKSVLKKDMLLAFMTQVEKEAIDSFKDYLKNTVEDIIESKSASQIHENVRLIREHLVAFGYMGLGQNIDSFGNTHEVYYPLMRIIDPDYKTPIVKYPIQFCVKDNRFMIQRSVNGIENPILVAGFTLNYRNHSSCYVFDGNHYVCLDNQKLDYRLPSILHDMKNLARGDLAKLGSYRKIKADELLEEPFRSNIGQFHLLPDNPHEFPTPLKWKAPKWERNNCFMASTLLLASLHYFYKKQGLNTVVNHQDSRFLRELWGCLDKNPSPLSQDLCDSTIALLREDEKEKFLKLVEIFNADLSNGAKDELRYYLLSLEPQTAYNRVYIKKLYLDKQNGNISPEDFELKIQEIETYIKNHSGKSIENVSDAHYCLSYLFNRGKAYEPPSIESFPSGLNQKTYIEQALSVLIKE